MREASKQEVQEAYAGWEPLVMQLIEASSASWEANDRPLTVATRPADFISPLTKLLYGQSTRSHACLLTSESA